MGVRRMSSRVAEVAVASLRRRLSGRSDRSALVARGMRIGEDTFIDPDTLFDADFCWLISVGDRCTIAPRVTIVAHDASTKRSLGYTRVGPVRLGDDTFIGAGSVILPGVTIGAGAIVGAGSVVRRDVPPGTMVTGNPAEACGDSAGYLARQRERLDEAPVYGGPLFDPGAGLADPLNQEILRAAEGAGTVFVE